MFEHMDLPVIVLSTRYHKHLGEITNLFNFNAVFNMQSFQEVSFDVYKFADGKECKLWDDIADFKYIYIPEYSEYYEIYVKTDETNNTVKHVTAKSAAEVELSNRMLYDFHCNDETDITFTPRYKCKDKHLAYEPVINGYYYDSKFYSDAEHTELIAPATATIYNNIPNGERYRWVGDKYDKETDDPKIAYNKEGVVDFEYDTEEGNVLEDEGQKSMYKATVIYRKINDSDSEWLKKKKMRSSLLHRVLHDKYPEWTIAHVDDSIANIQRIFTADKTNPYTFLTNNVAQEIDALFQFDSVNRTISLYDLDNICKECGYRGNFVDFCPKCGNTKKENMIEGYGRNTGIYISTENFAEQISIDGDSDNVKNAFRVSGGDDIITAAVRNCNPNGTNYLYHFSQDMLDEMPKELVKKLAKYEEEYASISANFEDLTNQWYQAVDDVMYLKSGKMPDTPIPGNTKANEQLVDLTNKFNKGQTVGLKGIEVNPTTSDEKLKARAYTKAVIGMAKAIIDPRYTVEAIEKAEDYPIISDYNTTTKTRTWTGKFRVTSLGKVDEKGNIEEAISETAVAVIVNDNEEEYLRQKIQKSLDRSDAAMKIIFDIEDDDEFEEALNEYCLSRLESFESTYQGAMEICADNGVTSENKDFYHVHLYRDIYEPLMKRRDKITAKIAKISEDIKALEKTRDDLLEQRKEIQGSLNLEDYLGEDLYNIYKLYLRESEFTNSNYISEGLDIDKDNYNSEVIRKARELIGVANEELLKASELQVSLTDNLYNLLSTKEFKNWKDKFEIGDWIINRIDDELYKLRLISVTMDYDTRDIQVTFSNTVRYRNNTSDIGSILSSAQSIATTYNYTAHQAKQGDEANTSIKDMENNGVDATKYNIVAGAENGVIIDEHGILCTIVDDATGEASPKQIKILNNMIAFTDDNWTTVSTGIGEITYNLNGKTQTEYGVNTKIMVAGKMIAGDIYSSNYSSSSNKGTHIDLNSGSFDLAGGKIDFNSDTNVLDINVAHINYGSGVNAPTVSQIDGLSTALAAKQDKLTAGTNITIDANNVISATGGGNANIYFGTTVPSDSMGENESVYMQYSDNGILNAFDYNHDVIDLISFEETDTNKYDMVISGVPTSHTRDFIEFDMNSLITGNTYTVSFKLQFNNEATFPWYGYENFVGVGESTVDLYTDTSLHTYTFNFTASGNDKLTFQFNRINDDVRFTATITDLLISGTVSKNIIDIYGKVDNKWRIYDNGSGLKYFKETKNTLSGSQALTLPKWTCLDGYYFDYAVEEHFTNGYCFNKSNSVPAIVLLTTFTAYGNYGSGGIIIISKQMSGADLSYTDTNDTVYNRPYETSSAVEEASVIYDKGTTTYNGETWYYAYIGGSGWSLVGQDGNVEYLSLATSGYPSDKMAEIFSKLQPINYNALYNGISRVNDLAFFAGGIDAEGSRAPIKIYNDGTYEGLDKVEDVQVDGTSVLDGDKIAKINLSGKQDRLTAGTNITIDSNNVISASGGGGSTVSITPSLATGTKIADYSIDGVTGELYAPTGGGGTGNVDDVYVNGESVLDTNNIAQVKTHKEVSLAEYEDANDNIIYFVDDDDDELGIYYSPIIYSTEEREVGTWTDGKPLYQRTWVFSTAVTISSNSWQATNIAVADTKIEFITKCKANNTDGQIMNYISATTDNATQTYVMLFNSRTNASMDVKYLTLEYTKSTDTPGSAKYNALGVPMVHYSTDEQVIGTWIDGKPIYRKIYDWTASPFLVSESWQNTDIDSTNIDRIINAVGMHPDGTLYNDTCADPTKSSHTRVGIKAWSSGYNAYLILEYTKTTD